MYTRGKIEKVCEVCNASFLVFHSESSRKYCSVGCKRISSRGCPGYWKGKKRSLETIEKIKTGLKGKKPWNKGLLGFMSGKTHHWYGINRSGENSPVWIKDRTKLKRFNDDSKDRRSSAYVEWRKQIWKRDNFKCKMSSKECKGKLEVHHILSWTEFPELRFNVNNGILLCHAHHPRKRAEEKRLLSKLQKLVSVSSIII